MTNEKINELKSLDDYFPKGNKKRGEALVLAAEAFLLGKESDHEELQEAYNIAMIEINKLRKLLGYDSQKIVNTNMVENSMIPTIRFETEEMRWDRIIKEKLNSVPSTPYD